MLEAAVAWTALTRERLDEAVEAGVLDKGDNGRRTTKFLALMNGASLFNNLPDGTIEDLDGFTRSLMVDLVSSWGADRKRLTRSASKAEAAADKVKLSAPSLA